MVAHRNNEYIMVRTIINSINTMQDWYVFVDKVHGSNTYKHSWFVYADCFNEGETRNEVLLADGLTEAEAQRIYKANKFAVENNGTDYAEIYIENPYNPYSTAAPHVYHRATGKAVDRAMLLSRIVESVRKKLN